MEKLLQEIKIAVIEGNNQAVIRFVEDALEEEINPVSILNQGLIEAMEEVGVRFETREFYIPEMLVSARAMQSGLALLKPHLKQSESNSRGKIVLGTVEGDLHDIGKNLVGIMLEGAGFDIHDIGTNATPEDFIQSIRETGAKLIGISALLTTTMINMKDVILALRKAGLRDDVKVIIGGAPVSEQYANEIGADGYAEDAIQAIILAKNLLGA